MPSLLTPKLDDVAPHDVWKEGFESWPFGAANGIVIESRVGLGEADGVVAGV